MLFNFEEYNKIVGKNKQVNYLGNYFFNNISEMLELINNNEFPPELIKDVLTLREKKTGNTFLHIAVQKNLYDLVQFLLQSSLNPFIHNANGKMASNLANDIAIRNLFVLHNAAIGMDGEFNENYLPKRLALGNNPLFKTSIECLNNPESFSNRNLHPTNIQIKIRLDQYIIAKANSIDPKEIELKTLVKNCYKNLKNNRLSIPAITQNSEKVLAPEKKVLNIPELKKKYTEKFRQAHEQHALSKSEYEKYRSQRKTTEAPQKIEAMANSLDHDYVSIGGACHGADNLGAASLLCVLSGVNNISVAVRKALIYAVAGYATIPFWANFIKNGDMLQRKSQCDIEYKIAENNIIQELVTELKDAGYNLDSIPMNEEEVIRALDEIRINSIPSVSQVPSTKFSKSTHDKNTGTDQNTALLSNYRTISKLSS